MCPRDLKTKCMNLIAFSSCHAFPSSKALHPHGFRYTKALGREEAGIIPRSADFIFTRIADMPRVRCTVKLSFVQIYLDKLQDLFDTGATLRIWVFSHFRVGGEGGG